jgi:hypothetical protein
MFITLITLGSIVLWLAMGWFTARESFIYDGHYNEAALNISFSFFPVLTPFLFLWAVCNFIKRKVEVRTGDAIGTIFMLESKYERRLKKIDQLERNVL